MLQHTQARFINFLRWSEKYTKTDMVYLARGGFWSLAGQIIAAIVALGVSVIFGRYVPKDVYGNYKFILSIVGILSIFSLSNMGTAVAQSAARGYDGALIQGYKLNLRWSILIFVGAIGFGAYYSYFGNFALAIGIALGGCVTPFLSGANLAGSYLNGKQDFPRATLYFGILGVIIPALALIGTIFITKNLLILVCVYFISNLIVDFYFYVRTVRLYHTREGMFDAGMFSYGKHLSIMGMIAGIAGGLDQLLLFHYTGAINLAVYAFAIGILDQVKGPVKTLDKMMQARFSNRGTAHIEASMENKMFWMLLVGISGIALFYVAAPFIYETLFPAYTDAIPYARLYACTLLGFGTVPIASYFASHKKIREQYFMNVGGSVVQILCMVVGVLWLGLWGLVLARVIANTINSLIILALYYFPPTQGTREQFV